VGDTESTNFTDTSHTNTQQNTNNTRGARTDAEVLGEPLPQREFPLLERLLQRRVRVPEGELREPRGARLAQRGVDGPGHRLCFRSCVCVRALVVGMCFGLMMSGCQVRGVSSSIKPSPLASTS
jgi:hypothetical protein